jgi:hypothetical protein
MLGTELIYYALPLKAQGYEQVNGDKLNGESKKSLGRPVPGTDGAKCGKIYCLHSL